MKGLYVPLDVNFCEDAKVLTAMERGTDEIGDRGSFEVGWFYVELLTMAKRLGTDGVVTRRQLERLHHKNVDLLIDILVDEGLLKYPPGRAPIGGRSVIVAAWLAWNRSELDLHSARVRDSNRKRRGRDTPEPVAGLDAVRVDAETDSAGEVEKSEVEQSQGRACAREDLPEPQPQRLAEALAGVLAERSDASAGAVSLGERLWNYLRGVEPTVDRMSAENAINRWRGYNLDDRMAIEPTITKCIQAEAQSLAYFDKAMLARAAEVNPGVEPW